MIFKGSDFTLAVALPALGLAMATRGLSRAEP